MGRLISSDHLIRKKYIGFADQQNTTQQDLQKRTAVLAIGTGKESYNGRK